MHFKYWRGFLNSAETKFKRLGWVNSSAGITEIAHELFF